MMVVFSLFFHVFTNCLQRGTSFGYQVRCTYVQLYQETFFDLMNPKFSRLTLRTGFDAENYVDGATEYCVSSADDALAVSFLHKTTFIFILFFIFFIFFFLFFSYLITFFSYFI